MEDHTSEVSPRALYLVMKDEVTMMKNKGEEGFDKFKEEEIGTMEKDIRGLGRYLKGVMSEASSKEEADRIFEVCYITYSMMKYYQDYPPKAR